MTSTAPVRCKCRKQAETGLRCSRCFVPICPDCSRPAPVGMLCRACAQGKPSHLYQIDPKSFALAIPVTLIVAVFGGWLMSTIRNIGFFGMLIGYLYGMAVGEVALRLTGRKRGIWIEILAGSAVLVGLIAGHAIQFAMLSALKTHVPYADDEAINPSRQVMLMMYLANPWMYVAAAVSILGAVSRIRNIG